MADPAEAAAAEAPETEERASPQENNGDDQQESAPPQEPLEAAPPKESRTEILERHQKEKKELHNKEMALKKAAAKGSKAEQKAKKKQVEEEISKLEAKMQARHAKELSETGSDKEESDLDGLLNNLSGVSVSSLPQKPTKAQKRRDKRAQEEAEREQRIQQEQNSIVSDRAIEDQLLEGKLRPLGFTLKEIKPDGHCLYRAVEDQLSLYPGICQQFSFQDLRQLAASYMRSHAEEFAPFVATDDDDSSESQEEKFERYCREVESTASWGGHLELDAIARSLKKHIIVFSGNLQEVEMGKEYEYKPSEGNGTSVNPSLRLSYHRHAFGLVVTLKGSSTFCQLISTFAHNDAIFPTSRRHPRT